MKKKLPLRQPPIISYLFHLFPLSILAQEETYLPWLYSTHIQLFSFPGEELKFYTTPFCTRHEIRHLYYQSCPLLDVQSIDRRKLSLSIAELTQWIVQCIDHNYYVQVDVDFFDLPQRPHYRRIHFIHDILIAGYDTQARTFSVVGFDKDGRYAIQDIGFEDICRALAYMRENYIDYMVSREQSPPPWFAASMADRPRVFLYRYLADQPCSFDPLVVAEQLEDYLRSNDTAQRHRLLATPRAGAAWGRDIYKALKQQVAILEHQPATYSDILWRLLWEHKKCMQARLLYMEQCGFIDSRQNSSTIFIDIEKKARSLHLILLRWKRERRARALAHAQSLIDTIDTAERPILDRVLGVLLNTSK